jgi:F-type H+-transporting ATPase subunit gamma
MERLSEIQARLKNLAELGEVVRAMRSLAAVRVQQVRAALPAVRQYAEVVDEALAEAFALDPLAAPTSAAAKVPTSVVAIVFSSEQGFVGAFNERVLDRAGAELGGPRDSLLVVGSRGAALARERRLAVAWTTAMTTRSDGVVAVGRVITREVLRRARVGELHRVVLVYARTNGGAASVVMATQLLPFDPTPFRSAAAKVRAPPLTNLTARELVDGLVDELLFAEIVRAATESFASENGARLATMEAAHASIEKKLEGLAQDERRRRQDEITTELLDIVTGADAVAAR